MQAKQGRIEEDSKRNRNERLRLKDELDSARSQAQTLLDTLKRDLKQAKRTISTLEDRLRVMDQEAQARHRRDRVRQAHSADEEQVLGSWQKTVSKLRFELATKGQQISELKEANQALHESLIEARTSTVSAKVVKIRDQDGLESRVLRQQLRKAQSALERVEQDRARLAEDKLRLEMELDKSRRQLDMKCSEECDLSGEFGRRLDGELL